MKIEQYHYEQYKVGVSDIFGVDLMAKELAYKSWLDVLDCDKSWARQNTDKSYEELISIFKESKLALHITLIMRKGMIKSEPEYYFEMGTSNMDKGPNYFTHHYLTVDSGKEIIKKFNLKRR